MGVLCQCGRRVTSFLLCHCSAMFLLFFFCFCSALSIYLVRVWCVCVQRRCCGTGKKAAIQLFRIDEQSTRLRIAAVIISYKRIASVFWMIIIIRCQIKSHQIRWYVNERKCWDSMATFANENGEHLQLCNSRNRMRLHKSFVIISKLF